MSALLATLLSAAIVIGAIAPVDADTTIYDLALQAVFHRTSGARLAVADPSLDMSRSWAYAAQPGSPTAQRRTRMLAYAAPATVEAFIRESSRSRPLPSALGKLKAYRLVDAARIAEAERRFAWDRFAREQGVDPAGVARVSAIGYNESRTEALLFVGSAETTWFVLLRRGDTGWVVTHADLLTQA